MCHSCILPLSLEKEITACLCRESCPWNGHDCYLYLKDALSGWAQALSRNHAYMAYKYGLACSAHTQCRHIPIFPTRSWPHHSVPMSGEPGSRWSHMSCSSGFNEGGKQDSLKGVEFIYFLFFLLQLKVMSVCCFSKPNHFLSSVRQYCAERSKVTHSKTQHPIGSVWQ